MIEFWHNVLYNQNTFVGSIFFLIFIAWLMWVAIQLKNM